MTQAAVWICTDNPSDYDLLNTLTRGGFGGFGGTRVINEEALEEAKRIVRERCGVINYSTGFR